MAGAPSKNSTKRPFEQVSCDDLKDLKEAFESFIRQDAKKGRRLDEMACMLAILSLQKNNTEVTIDRVSEIISDLTDEDVDAKVKFLDLFLGDACAHSQGGGNPKARRMMREMLDHVELARQPRADVGDSELANAIHAVLKDEPSA